MIDGDKFKDYCLATALPFVQLYPWYNMQQSLHRILILGWQVVDQMMLPIGMMSKEAQAARNKDF